MSNEIPEFGSREHLRAIEPPNPIVRRTALVKFPGWVVRTYKDGMLDAEDTRPGHLGLTVGCDTWQEVLTEVARHEREDHGKGFAYKGVA